MNTIEAFENDVKLQLKFLKKFSLPKKINENKQSKSIFCGSGDSLASSLLAEAYSGFKVKAADPLDLIKNKKILKKNEVYVVSISGKTVSNIKVARLAKKSYAITSSLNSTLAKTCSELIQLKFPNSDVFTAGSISFIDSALTCISLVSPVAIPNPEMIFQNAQKQSQNIDLKKRVFFLGNLHTYPIALYAAAKLFEILGFDAYYERLEQFSHMELFSTKPGDTVVIFEEKNPHNSNLAQNLKNVGLNVIQPNPNTTDKISQFLFYTFFSQLVPLSLAKKGGQKECHFVLAKKLRKISDDMIY